MKFTFEAYLNLLRLIQERYTIKDYHTYQNSKNLCILRHDIDMSVEKAITIAEIEHSLGIKATYFVLLNTGFYNCLYSNTIESIHTIQRLGHEIGLHFDEMQYSDCNEEEKLKGHVYDEAIVLEKAIGERITTISMHRPSNKTLESDYCFDGIINCYSKVFFSEFKYLSDSRMHWRENVEEIVNSGDQKMLHILTHPIWYTDTGRTMQDILKDFVHRGASDRYLMLEKNIRDLNQIIKNDEI